jgi:hypothetical protein
VIVTDRWRSEPPCVHPPAKAGPHGQTEIGGRVLTVNAGARAPRGVSPDRALCLSTFSHFVIVDKTSLSLSLSLDRALCLPTFSHFLIVNTVSFSLSLSLSLSLARSLSRSLALAHVGSRVRPAARRCPGRDSQSRGCGALVACTCGRRRTMTITIPACTPTPWAAACMTLALAPAHVRTQAQAASLDALPPDAEAFAARQRW